MNRYPWRLLFGAVLLAGLATCGNPDVEVNFAQPFPTRTPDLAGFAPADQGRYAAVNDTTITLLLGEKLLSRQFSLSREVTARQLDSLGLPARSGAATTADGQVYQVQPGLAGGFQLHWALRDTLLCLGPGTHLRRYRGWYYVSTPDGPRQPGGDSAGTWTVQRLAVAGRHLLTQRFNPDTLRIRALEPATVHLRRENNRQVFTLIPPDQRAARQVSSYSGLWLDEGSYVRR